MSSPPHTQKEISEWNINDLNSYLLANKYRGMADLFLKNSINGYDLFFLTEDKLKNELNLSTFHERQATMKLVSKLTHEHLTLKIVNFNGDSVILTLDNDHNIKLGDISEYVGNMFNIDPKYLLYKDNTKEEVLSPSIKIVPLMILYPHTYKILNVSNMKDYRQPVSDSANETVANNGDNYSGDKYKDKYSNDDNYSSEGFKGCKDKYGNNNDNYSCNKHKDKYNNNENNIKKHHIKNDYSNDNDNDNAKNDAEIDSGLSNTGLETLGEVGNNFRRGGNRREVRENMELINNSLEQSSSQFINNCNVSHSQNLAGDNIVYKAENENILKNYTKIKGNHINLQKKIKRSSDAKTSENNDGNSSWKNMESLECRNVDGCRYVNKRKHAYANTSVDVDVREFGRNLKLTNLSQNKKISSYRDTNEQNPIKNETNLNQKNSQNRRNFYENNKTSVNYFINKELDNEKRGKKSKESFGKSNEISAKIVGKNVLLSSNDDEHITFKGKYNMGGMFMIEKKSYENEENFSHNY